MQKNHVLTQCSGLLRVSVRDFSLLGQGHGQVYSYPQKRRGEMKADVKHYLQLYMYVTVAVVLSYIRREREGTMCDYEQRQVALFPVPITVTSETAYLLRRWMTRTTDLCHKHLSTNTSCQGFVHF